MLSHLLIFRLVTVNTLAGALAWWAHSHGLVTPIFANDISYLSYATVALFAVTLASTFWRAAKVSAALNALKTYHSLSARQKAAKMHDKAAHIADAVQWLQTLGFLGTVIGFGVAVKGHTGGDTTAVLNGLYTAIGTTIIGTILSLLTSVNYRMLETATLGYVEDVR
jgi:hypothetical protein